MESKVRSHSPAAFSIPARSAASASAARRKACSPRVRSSRSAVRRRTRRRWAPTSPRATSSKDRARNHGRFQNGGVTVTRSLAAEASYQTPSLLDALTWKA